MMSYFLSRQIVNSDFVHEVMKRSGQNILSCYQCGKCSAGCPMRYQMDLQPNQIMRLVQLGMMDAAFNSNSIWMCISCETCTTRCPREMEPARVMDTLRSMSYARESARQLSPGQWFRELGSRLGQALLGAFNMEVKDNVRTFNSVFLENVRRQGRSFEMSLIGGSNTSTGYLVRNILKAPIMLLKGKMEFIPERVARMKKIEKIFEKVEESENTKI